MNNLFLKLLIICVLFSGMFCYSVNAKNEKSSDIISAINNNSAVIQQSDINNQVTSKSNEPSIINLITSLIVVIFLIFLTGWGYNKLLKINPKLLMRDNISNIENNKLHVLSSASLGQGKTVHVVEIKGKCLVVGTTSNNISLLSEYPNLENTQVSNKTEQINNNIDADNTKKNTKELDVEEIIMGNSSIYDEYL